MYDRFDSLERSFFMAAEMPISGSALYPVVCVESPQSTATAFQRVFGLVPVFESDWYVQLAGDGGMQLGLVRFDHDSVPVASRAAVSGSFVTVDVSDAAQAWAEWQSELDIVQPLTDEEWGQRHFIAGFPGGVIVDVVETRAA
jgi:hypothetical protein